MQRTAFLLLGLAAAFCFGFKFNADTATKQKDNIKTIEMEDNIKLGVFSLSMSVKDLKVSKQFYENLGFTVFGGGMEQNYLIMKNENTLIGLFQGMFQGNMLTFNPGWDANAQNIEKFDDIRKIQQHLKIKGIKLTSEADEKTSGPASLTLTDPDGNVILLDQHR